MAIVHGAPLEELWKHEEDPLEIWQKLVTHVTENRAPEAAGQHSAEPEVSPAAVRCFDDYDRAMHRDCAISYLSA